MKELINEELIKLQDELNSLNAAVTHIHKAGQIANEVIDAISAIQANYSQHLQQVLEYYKNAVDETSTYTRDEINTLVANHEQQVKHLGILFEETQAQTKAFLEATEGKLKSSFDKSDAAMDQVFLHTKHQIDGLTLKHSQFLTEQSRLLEEYTRLTLRTEKQNQDYLDKQYRENTQRFEHTFETFENRITKFADAHQQNIDSMNTLLTEYEELGQSTAVLFNKINKIDFPTQFDLLSQQVSGMYKNMDSITAKMELIENQIQTNNSENKTIKTIAWVSLILLGAIFAEMIIRHFPS